MVSKLMPRPWLLLVVAVSACKVPPRAGPVDAGPVDAGPPRPVVVKLGGTISDITGDPRPWPGGAKPLSFHELKGPLELTVEFPSGRRYRRVVPEATVGIAEPAPRVTDVDVHLGMFKTWEDARAAIEAELDPLGVSEAGLRADRWKLAQKRVNHPSWPIEGCITVTGTNFDKASKAIVVTLEIGETTPQVWHTIHGEYWPDTCPRDGGR